MCAPKMPTPPPQRQAAKAPDQGALMRRTSDQLRKRMGFASTVNTSGSMPAPATTGKTLLGA